MRNLTAVPFLSYLTPAPPENADIEAPPRFPRGGVLFELLRADQELIHGARLMSPSSVSLELGCTGSVGLFSPVRAIAVWKQITPAWRHSPLSEPVAGALREIPGRETLVASVGRLRPCSDWSPCFAPSAAITVAPASSESFNFQIRSLESMFTTRATSRRLGVRSAAGSNRT